MPGRHNTTESFGVFSSPSSLRAVSREDAQRLTYTTTNGDTHRGKQLRAEDIFENFQEVHDMGKQDTKYMDYQLKKAPLLDRTSTKMARDFVAKPLSDYLATRELADSFRAPDPTRPRLVLDSQTSYGANFRKLPVETRLNARQPPRKETTDSSRTLGGRGGWLAAKSQAQDVHSQPRREFSVTQDPFVPRSYIDVGQAPKGNAWLSQSSRDAADTWGPGLRPSLARERRSRRKPHRSASSPQI